MNFKEAFEADKAVLMNQEEFAIPVEYISKAGGSKNITAVFNQGSSLDTGYRGGAVGEAATLVVWTSDVPAPQHGDVAVIDGVSWKIMKKLEGDSLSWTLDISNNLRPGI